MSIRAKLNQNPAVIIGLVIVVIAVALFVVFRQVKALSPSMEDQAFFSVDDGKTWFLDNVHQIPPFDHGGQPAVRVYLYTCKGNPQPFVGYMERYTDSARKQLLDLREKAKAQPTREKALMVSMQAMGIQQTGTEYKKPGYKDWSKTSIAVKCDSGRGEDLERVIPGQ